MVLSAMSLPTLQPDAPDLLYPVHRDTHLNSAHNT